MLWENNPGEPWHTTRDEAHSVRPRAQPLSPPVAMRLLTESGLSVSKVTSHFYFPSWLTGLRRFERRLERIPLGAQYCVVAGRGLVASGAGRQR